MKCCSFFKLGVLLFQLLCLTLSKDTSPPPYVNPEFKEIYLQALHEFELKSAGVPAEVANEILKIKDGHGMGRPAFTDRPAFRSLDQSVEGGKVQGALTSLHGNVVSTQAVSVSGVNKDSSQVSLQEIKQQFLPLSQQKQVVKSLTEATATSTLSPQGQQTIKNPNTYDINDFATYSTSNDVPDIISPLNNIIDTNNINNNKKSQLLPKDNMQQYSSYFESLYPGFDTPKYIESLEDPWLTGEMQGSVSESLYQNGAGMQSFSSVSGGDSSVKEGFGQAQQLGESSQIEYRPAQVPFLTPGLRAQSQQMMIGMGMGMGMGNQMSKIDPPAAVAASSSLDGYFRQQFAQRGMPWPAR